MPTAYIGIGGVKVSGCGPKFSPMFSGFSNLDYAGLRVADKSKLHFRLNYNNPTRGRLIAAQFGLSNEQIFPPRAKTHSDGDNYEAISGR